MIACTAQLSASHLSCARCSGRTMNSMRMWPCAACGTKLKCHQPVRRSIPPHGHSRPQMEGNSFATCRQASLLDFFRLAMTQSMRARQLYPLAIAAQFPPPSSHGHCFPQMEGNSLATCRQASLFDFARLATTQSIRSRQLYPPAMALHPFPGGGGVDPSGQNTMLYPLDPGPLLPLQKNVDFTSS